MDKSWMTKPRYSNEYIYGLERFLDFAFTHTATISRKILCPCAMCGNHKWKSRDEVRDHVILKGMTSGYTVWVCHGEDFIMRDAPSPITSDPSHNSPLEDHSNMHNLASDAFGIHDILNELNEDVEEEESNEDKDDSDPDVEPNIQSEDGYNEDATRFFEFFQEGNKELYPGSKSTILSFVVQLMHIKSYYKWSGKSVGMLIKFLKQQFPESNILETLYEAKKITNALGLGYENIDVCPNNCMLYRGDRATQQSCHVCKSSRWQHDDNISSRSHDRKKNIACKVMRYFPLIPRLQRLYMSPKTSSSMIWHDKDRIKDGLLRHPADSHAWKAFDKKYPDFAHDPRNVRLGLTSDGFNPFGSMSNAYNIWPVVLIPYNLPPWICMKQSSLILSTIISGKDTPGDRIDIFLQPLIDELLQLWEGVRAYDATSKQNFTMRAALMWTINDFLAYAYLSGWSTRGKNACPCCADMTESKWLPNGNKYCYLGHRRRLSDSHKFRAQKYNFDGTEERRTAPKTLSGSDALRQLQGVSFIDESIVNMRNEASISKRKRTRDTSPLDDSFDEAEFDEGDDVGTSRSWKKKSVFFKLPYWEFNILRHNLDVMHIEKNVRENVLRTLLNIKGKSKDDPKARYDLVLMKIRHKLHPVELPNGKTFFPPASYSMTRKEKEIFLNVLKDVKVPDGYASRISRGINVKDRKLQSLKTHDYHILMQDLFSIALRSCLNKQVTKLIIELSSVFKAICCKALNVDELDIMKSRAALVLCHLERCFPPSFFTIVVHLVIHLVDEAKVASPVQYRWMYPIERCLKVFKKYVGNRAHPEGSITEGYVVEECHTFCLRYFDGIETVFNRPRQNGDIDPIERNKYLLSSGGIFKGAAEIKILDSLSLVQAHRYA